MTRAIWLIGYDVASADEARYLEWFHHVHMPEKLARPGYLWAAHYEAITPDGAPALLNGIAASETSRGFIAVFGGEDTRTFLNPSPAQIKPNQPPLTREMMGLRVGSRSLIAAEEWRIESADDQPSYAFLELAVCDTGAHDEDFGAWCVQAWAPHMTALPGVEVVAKWLSSTAAAKHVRVTSFNALEAVHGARSKPLTDDWSERVGAYQVYGDWQPLLGRRIWREPDSSL